MAKKKPIKATPVTAMATVNLDMTLDRDDVVAIQVSEIENKLMTYEQQVSVAIEKLQGDHNAAVKEATKLLKDHANEVFGPRLATLRASIAVVEEIGEDKLEVRIDAMDGGSSDCGYVPDDIDEEYDAGENDKVRKTYAVRLIINRTTQDRKNHQYGYSGDHLYCSQREIAKPAAYFKLVTVAQKAMAGINENRKLIQKARESLSKMGSLERNCRAELAKMRLKEIGREDVIATISKVGIPGMPQLMQPVLEAPAGKAYPAPK